MQRQLREGVTGTCLLLNVCCVCHLQVPFWGFDYCLSKRHWDCLPFLCYVSLCPNTTQYSPADKPTTLQIPTQNFFFLSSWSSQQGTLAGYHPLLGQSRQVCVELSGPMEVTTEWYNASEGNGLWGTHTIVLSRDCCSCGTEEYPALVIWFWALRNYTTYHCHLGETRSLPECLPAVGLLRSRGFSRHL